MQSSTGNIASGVALALARQSLDAVKLLRPVADPGGGCKGRTLPSLSRVGKMGGDCLLMPLNGRPAADTCPISVIDGLKCKRKIVAFQWKNWSQYQTRNN